MPAAKPHFKIKQILAWADEHHARTGKWPNAKAGLIRESNGDTWSAVTTAFARGKRGLPLGSSLAGLLAEHRGVRSKAHAPPLAISSILDWAKSHRRRTGQWPRNHSGTVVDAPGETWLAINLALLVGGRGLSGGESLAKLLARRCGAPYCGERPKLSIRQILDWADVFHQRTHGWPNRFSRSIAEMRDERWSVIESALYVGTRGLPGDQTLPQILAEHRGVRNRGLLAPLTIKRILKWADAHRARTGRWPNSNSGIVHDAPTEKWTQINGCLVHGHRGLPAELSVTKLLVKHRSIRSKAHRPNLTRAQILKWADAHHARVGSWPGQSDGEIPDSDGETWSAVHAAFARGNRGMHAGSSFRTLLEKERGVRNPVRPPRLSIELVLQWADVHRRQNGIWPGIHSGPVQGASGETWNAINVALAVGGRSLPGGTSLNALLVKHRGKRDRNNLPDLSLKQILQWTDAHYEATGEWPSRLSGPLINEPEEHWGTINNALKRGKRGLPLRWTLVRLLTKFRAEQYRRGGMPLSIERILEWIAVHHELAGKPPTAGSGAVIDESGENWKAIDVALRVGSRNLRGRSSLAMLIASRYEPPYKGIGQALTVEKIMAWASDFKARVGTWPTKRSAYVFPRPNTGERWSVIDRCLREGTRGLTGGSSMAKLMNEIRCRRKAMR